MQINLKRFDRERKISNTIFLSLNCRIYLRKMFIFLNDNLWKKSLTEQSRKYSENILKYFWSGNFICSFHMKKLIYNVGTLSTLYIKCICRPGCCLYLQIVLIRIIKDEQLFSVFHQLSVLGRNKINKSIFQKIAVKNYLQINLTGARISTICSLNGSNFSTLSSSAQQVDIYLFLDIFTSFLNKCIFTLFINLTTFSV